MTSTYIASGFAVGPLVGLLGVGDDIPAARAVPEKFLRGLLASTVTGVAAEPVL